MVRGSDGQSGGSAASGSSSEPADTMAERSSASRVTVWLLLDANRWFVAVGLLFGIFATLLLVGTLDPAPLRGSVGSKDPVETLFQGLLTAIITGVTLVVTINQLVLSQELGPLGDQHDRMGGAMTFREDVEEHLGLPAAPPTPAAFLRALIEDTGDRARSLAESPTGDATLDERIETYATELETNADAVTTRLRGREFGTFGVLFAALDFNYSWKIYEGRRLRNQYGGDLPTEVRDVLDELVRTLSFYGPAREHIKTLYFQWELIDLSRAMLYTAVPALLVSIGSILFLDNPGTIVGRTAGVDNLLWVTVLAATVAVTPFAVLLSFVLRISTVAKRTLSIGPFILRDETHSSNDEWLGDRDDDEQASE